MGSWAVRKQKKKVLGPKWNLAEQECRGEDGTRRVKSITAAMTMPNSCQTLGKQPNRDC